MATQDLNVKFKIDSSDVTRGSEDAKNKVKNAANEMASDVKNSSQQMSNSFQEVANNAENAAKQMEKSFDSSAKNMEKSMDSVNKKVSAMQLFHLGARGVGMLGGAAQNIMRLNGNVEDAESLGNAVNVAQGGMQGAAVGFAAAGPWGAAAGALVGAGNALLEAAVKQKEAAEASINANRDVIDVTERQNQDRTLAEWANETASATNFDEEFAQDQIDAAKERIAAAQAQLNDALDIAKGRAATQYTGVGFQIDGKTLENGRDFGNIDWTNAAQTNALQEQLGDTLFKYIHDLVTDNVKDANQELADAQKELALLAPLQARINQIKAERAKKEQETLQESWRSFDEYQKGKDAVADNKDAIKATKEELSGKNHTLASLQSELNGVIARPFETPRDSLTRIGGGNGYASYNNSTAQVQKNIENHLKSVIKLMQESITETTTRLDALINKDTEMVWANP